MFLAFSTSKRLFSVKYISYELCFNVLVLLKISYKRGTPCVTEDLEPIPAW